MIFRSSQEVHFITYDRYAPVKFTHHKDITLYKSYTFRRSAHGVFMNHTSINIDIYDKQDSFIFENWTARGLWGGLVISHLSLRIGFIVSESENNYHVYILKDNNDVYVGNVMQLPKANLEVLPTSFKFECISKDKLTQSIGE